MPVKLNYKIYPIPLFKIASEKSVMTYMRNYGQQITAVAYIWYIEGPKEKILIDAGGSSEYMTKVRGNPSTDIQTLPDGLRKVGLNFGDIDLIIVTHLHHDHIAQANRYPKARFLVQRDELDFARNPHPCVAPMYCQEHYKNLKFEVIDGDAKVCEGISVLKTPGHSPGGQSVSIQTAAGKAIIAGFCSIRDNFDPPPPLTVPLIAPGAHTNVLSAYDSVLRVKKEADIAIPLHDAGFVSTETIP